MSRSLADGDSELPAFVAAENVDGRFAAGIEIDDELADMADRLPAVQPFLVDLQEDVAGLDASIGGGFAGFDGFHQDGAVIKIEGFEPRARKFLHGDAEVAASDFAFGEELVGDFFGGVAGD